MRATAQGAKRRSAPKAPQEGGKSLMMISLFVLVAAAVFPVPKATAWMPTLTRPTSFVSNKPQQPLLSTTAPRARMPFVLQARRPADEDEDEDDWDEEEIDLDEEYEDEDEDKELDDDEEDVEYEDDSEDEDVDEEEYELEIEDNNEILASHEQLNNDKEEEEEEAWEEEDEVYLEPQTSAEGSVISSAVDWDGDEGDYPLEDDPDDENYQKQKELLEQAIEDSDRVGRDRNFDAVDFMMNELDEDQMEQLDQLPFFQEVEKKAESIVLSEEDLDGVDLEKELEKTSSIVEDPYPVSEDGEEQYLNIAESDLANVDEAWQAMQRSQSVTPWDKVNLRASTGWEGLSNETMEEIIDCMDEIGGASYNVTKWILYDLDFNVTNLMLAAVKHNREAPILFQHWYPQLNTYSRYKDAQDRDFDFTWDDVEAADLSELERYYQGMGYNKIPEKAPAETGMVEFDYLDEEEIKMAAFESWVSEVYNSEHDRKDFDDDEWRDEDNVFSNYYEHPPHPDLPSFEETQEDLGAWHDKMGTDEELAGDDATKAYRDHLAQGFNYSIVDDEEFEEEFRGHLVVACTGDDADLEIAERITLAMEKAHGKQVYVETQIIAHAREEDNVFEVWLESYEIELLHSKRRATSNTKDWDGPSEIDDKQLDYLVDRVGFLISDDARYSYSYEFDGVV